MSAILKNALELLEKWGPTVSSPPRCVYRMGADLNGSPIGCDCSAFVARCCGQRKFDGAVWWNTDRIYDDATGANKRWRQIPAPVPGCIGVYPGRSVSGRRRAGHVWVVENPATFTTIECSSSGKGINRMKRPGWFVPAAKGNGKLIVWAEFVGGEA